MNVNLFIGIIATVLVSGCSSIGNSVIARPTGIDSQVQTLCSGDQSIETYLLDESKTNFERYAAVTKALQCLKRPLNSPEAQNYAVLATHVGQYQNARNAYGHKGKLISDPALESYAVASALPTILKLTKQRRAVFVNESHANSETRAFFYTLLKPLRDQGFNYLALEGLTMGSEIQEANREQRNECGVVPFDSELNIRGYPTRKTGYYVRDPLFGLVVRQALALGYTIIGYDSPLAETFEARERAQASKLVCVVTADLSAKLLVLGGFGHILKASSGRKINPDHPKVMVDFFQELSDVDPLSIDTTAFIGVDSNKINFNSKLVSQSPELSNGLGSGMQFINNHDLITSPGADLAIYLPNIISDKTGRPRWLSLNGERRSMDVGNQCGGGRPCQLRLRFVGEDEKAIPLDSCVLLSSMERNCALFVPGGPMKQYEIEAEVLH